MGDGDRALQSVTQHDAPRVDGQSEIGDIRDRDRRSFKSALVVTSENKAAGSVVCDCYVR